MGLQLPQRARRTALAVMLGTSLLLLGACSDETNAQFHRWAMPANSPGTKQAVYIADLWQWAWVAALITGVIVWTLILYACFAFHRRSDDEIPVQTRYNLPLEIFYTIAPVMMIVVLFYWTVVTQNKVLDEVDNPDHTIEVVGQQWSWTFNYSSDRDVTGGKVAYAAGTASHIPTLVLPVDQTIEFQLSSPDVIHSFWIPGFLMKMDVIPGQVGADRNHFQVKTTKLGTFEGKCAELCGVYHSRMLFDVQVVSEADYEIYLKDLEARGDVADEPLLGGEDARTQAGLEDAQNETGGTE